MFIKTKIHSSIRGSVEHHEKVRDLLKAIDEQFETSDKALASTLIMKFSSTRLTNVRGVRDHIMKMRDIAAQLKRLEVEMSDSFLVHYILNTLPQEYAPFKISYNTHKDKWSINELMTMCVQEEGRLLMEQGESSQSAHLAVQGRKKYQAQKKGKGKIPPQANIKKESKCFFCKKKGHIKKNCEKFAKWLEDKGIFANTPTSLVCFESNMADICHDTWWIDSGCTIHVTNVLQDLQNPRKPVGSEKYIYSGNKMSSHVEAIGDCSLVLSSGFVLALEKTFYVPKFSRKLISVSRLVPFGYSFQFSNENFHLYYKSELVGNGTLSDGLFRINLLNNNCYNATQIHAGIKRCVMNEDSSMLWHRRLGHISIDRIKKLVNERILSVLVETCRDCIKGKQTNKSKKGAKRSSDILEIIHTDICSLDIDSSRQKYFITFIDDYSRYMYLYLLQHKNEALDAFKVFKAEVEKQCSKQIKVVRSDRGGEYYGRYTEDGQAPGLFAKFF